MICSVNAENEQEVFVAEYGDGRPSDRHALEPRPQLVDGQREHPALLRERPMKLEHRAARAFEDLAVPVVQQELATSWRQWMPRLEPRLFEEISGTRNILAADEDVDIHASTVGNVPIDMGCQYRALVRDPEDTRVSEQ